MELEIYNAFIKAGVAEADAKAVVESINKEIDKRYSLHSSQLATRGDIAELKTTFRSDLADFKIDMMKWTVGTTFSAVGLFAAITKIWH